MIARESQLLGIHLNDGYGRRDDGLMVGTVNFMQTLEVLFQLIRKGFDGVIYFDTFPDVSGLDPIRECENNIAMVDSLWNLAKELKAQPDLAKAIESSRRGRQSGHRSTDHLWTNGRSDSGDRLGRRRTATSRRWRGCPAWQHKITFKMQTGEKEN